MTYTVGQLPTWLDIVQRSAQEMGVSGAAANPASVLNQTGEAKRVVDWVYSAYEKLQKSKPWGWLFTTTTQSITNALGREYNPRTQWTIGGNPLFVREWDLDSFKLAITSIGVGDQQFLSWWPWERFKGVYDIRSPQTIRPYVFSIKPNGNLILQTIPDVNYTLTADLWLAKDYPATDAAVPLIPEEFRMLVVWEAVKLYAAYEQDQALLGAAMLNAKTLRMEMEELWLPPDVPDDPLV
jgi:hypothetical protein